MSMHFDLVDLRLMTHIAEANSMTRGSELSCISLPAASTRIKNLEDSIGTKLLYRTSQGVTLTPPGQAFVTHARMVLTARSSTCAVTCRSTCVASRAICACMPTPPR
jgi:DNA-binding transcriptional LysR family regulator